MGDRFLNSMMLDLSIVLILIIFWVLGFRGGVMKSFLGLAGSIFAAFFSVYSSGKVSQFVYFEFIAPILSKNIESAIARNPSDMFSLMDKFPKFILDSLPNYGITPDTLTHIINSNTMAVIPGKVIELLASPAINVLKSLFTVLLFVIFLFLVRFLSKFILKIFKAPLLKKVNSFFGGILGIFKGYIAIVVCMCCLKAILPFWHNAPEVFLSESVSGTRVFKEIYNNNPMYEFFKNM